jgi:hypothetical protein
MNSNWDSHNHGPAEGRGLDCGEKPIGWCVRLAKDAELAELRAEVERLRSAERFHWRPKALTGDRHAIEAEIEHARAEAAERALADERAKVARLTKQLQHECPHWQMSHSGVDQTSLDDAQKVWACDNCGKTGTSAALDGPEPDTTSDGTP